MKEQKLLNKTLRYYLGYGLLAALFVIPVFYLLMKKYYLHEIDEYLYLQREKIVVENFNTLKISEIPTWNLFNLEEAILPDAGQVKADVFITEPVYSDHEKGYIPYRILYSPVEIEGEKFILTVRLNIYESRKILQSSALLQLLLFICLMAGMTYITRLIHGKLWRPFYKTLSQTEQFNIRQNDIPHFASTGTQEFDQLNRAIITLIDNNLQAYNIQKEFTENASHEMQTPLAILRSKLDLLLQQPNLTEAQLQIIQTLYEVSARLVRMNKNLLLLAKMDNQQFPETQTLNVSDLLEELLSSLSEQTIAANITLETQITDRSLTLQANKMLLESLFNNLLTNAIRHNVPGGKISVILKANRFDVLNTGIEQPLDSARLFRRFGRTVHATQRGGLHSASGNPPSNRIIAQDNGLHSASGNPPSNRIITQGNGLYSASGNPPSNRIITHGNGLGLAIVRQIGSLYGWQIDYDFENGLHRFGVTFTIV